MVSVFDKLSHVIEDYLYSVRIQGQFSSKGVKCLGIIFVFGLAFHHSLWKYTVLEREKNMH